MPDVVRLAVTFNIHALTPDPDDEVSRCKKTENVWYVTVLTVVDATVWKKARSAYEGSVVRPKMHAANFPPACPITGIKGPYADEGRALRGTRRKLRLAGNTRTADGCLARGK